MTSGDAFEVFYPKILRIMGKLMTLIPIRGNALGLAMIVATGLIAGVGALLLHLDDALVMIAVGVALIVMDLLIRLTVRQAQGWLTRPEFGGYLFFVPIWVVGIAIILINLINVFVVRAGA